MSGSMLTQGERSGLNHGTFAPGAGFGMNTENLFLESITDPDFFDYANTLLPPITVSVFRRQGTPVSSAGGVGAAVATVPTGVLTTDYGVFSVSGNDANTGAGTWTCSRSSVTFTTLVSPTNVNNSSIYMVEATGLQPGDTVTFTPTAAAVYRLTSLYFTTQMNVGTVYTRGGTTLTTVAAPSALVPAGPVYIYSMTRQNTVGNDVASVINANGYTTRYIYKNYLAATDPAVNVALYEFTSPGGATGITTETDSQASGNGAALHLWPAQAGPTVYADVSNSKRPNSYQSSLAVLSTAVGDVLVTMVMSEDDTPINSPAIPVVTQGGVTQTDLAKTPSTNYTYNQISVATVSVAGAKTVTVAGPSSSQLWSVVVLHYKAADGYSCPSPTLLRASSASGAPSLTWTPSAVGNALAWCNGDWNANDGLSRTRNSPAIEDGYSFLATYATMYWAHETAASALTKTVGYSVPSGQKYEIQGVEIAWALASGKTPVSTTRTLSWATKASVADSRTMSWSVKSIVADARSLLWAVKTSVLDNRTLSWVTKALISDSRTLSWSIKAPVSDSRTVSWDTKASVSDTRTVSWSVKSVVSSTRNLLWSVKQSLSDTRSILWDVAGVKIAVGFTRAMSWDTKSILSLSRTVSWDTKASVSFTRSLLWSVKQAVVSSRTMSWLTKQAVALSRTVSWDTKGIFSSTRTMSWSVKQTVSSTRTLSWSVKQAVLSSRIIQWSTKQVVSSALSILFNTQAAVIGSRTVLFDSKSAIGSSRVISFDTKSIVSDTRELSWNVIVVGETRTWYVRNSSGAWVEAHLVGVWNGTEIVPAILARIT